MEHGRWRRRWGWSALDPRRRQKPTGKKAVIYVGNLKLGAKDNEVTEYIKRRCEKLRIRPPNIHNCKIFEKNAEKGEIVEFCGARLTIDQGVFEIICDRQFWPGRSPARPWVFRDRETSKENNNAEVIPALRDDAGERTERTPNTTPALPNFLPPTTVHVSFPKSSKPF